MKAQQLIAAAAVTAIGLMTTSTDAALIAVANSAGTITVRDTSALGTQVGGASFFGDIVEIETVFDRLVGATRTGNQIFTTPFNDPSTVLRSEVVDAGSPIVSIDTRIVAGSPKMIIIDDRAPGDGIQQRTPEDRGIGQRFYFEGFTSSFDQPIIDGHIRADGRMTVLRAGGANNGLITINPNGSFNAFKSLNTAATYTTSFISASGNNVVGRTDGGVETYTDGGSFVNFGDVNGATAGSIVDIEQLPTGELVIATDGGEIFIRSEASPATAIPGGFANGFGNIVDLEVLADGTIAVANSAGELYLRNGLTPGVFVGFQSGFGSIVSITSYTVPEPSALALVGSITLMGLRRRTRRR